MPKASRASCQQNLWEAVSTAQNCLCEARRPGRFPPSSCPSEDGPSGSNSTMCVGGACDTVKGGTAARSGKPGVCFWWDVVSSDLELAQNSPVWQQLELESLGICYRKEQCCNRKQIAYNRNTTRRHLISRMRKGSGRLPGGSDF